MEKISKIMVALAFSKYAGEIFNYAARLSLALKAELLVVNVINVRDVEAIERIAGMGYEMDPEKYVADLKAERKAVLEKIVETSPVSSDEVKLLFKVGNPIEELLKIIIDHEIDMVVLGVKGRTDLERILIGSVAEKLFRRSPVTVVSYRDPENSKKLRRRIDTE